MDVTISLKAGDATNSGLVVNFFSNFSYKSVWLGVITYYLVDCIQLCNANIFLNLG